MSGVGVGGPIPSVACYWHQHEHTRMVAGIGCVMVKDTQSTSGPTLRLGVRATRARKIAVRVRRSWMMPVSDQVSRRVDEADGLSRIKAYKEQHCAELRNKQMQTVNPPKNYKHHLAREI